MKTKVDEEKKEKKHKKYKKEQYKEKTWGSELNRKLKNPTNRSSLMLNCEKRPTTKYDANRLSRRLSDDSDNARPNAVP